MNESIKAQKVISQKTLLPVGLVLTAFGVGMTLLGVTLSLTYALATDRATLLSDVKANRLKNIEQDQQLNQLDHELDYLVKATYRIEARLGTLPTHKQKQDGAQP